MSSFSLQMVSEVPGACVTSAQVGEIVAFDALINNVDRVPLLWDNEGMTPVEDMAPHVLSLAERAVTHLKSSISPQAEQTVFLTH